MHHATNMVSVGGSMNQLTYSTDEHVISIEVIGPQNQETVEAMLREVQAMQAYFDVGFSDTKLLIDTRKAGRVSGSAIPAAIKFLSTLEYVAVAIIRRGGMMKALVDTIVEHTAKDMNIRLFETRLPAYRWLASANATNAHLVLDDQWQFISANSRARDLAAMTDRPLGNIKGRSIYEIFPELRGTDIERLMNKARQTREFQRADLWYPPANRYYRVEVFPSHSSLSIYYTDITERFAEAHRPVRADS